MPTLLERVSALFTPTRSKMTSVADLLGASWPASANTEDGAMRVAAVYACVRVIARTIASLPLITYRVLPDQSKVRAYDDPLYDLLHLAPNPDQTSMEFREQLMVAVLLRGNGYARVRRNGRGEARELLPLHPDKVRPQINGGGAIVAYQYGDRETLLPSEVLHVRNLTSDGVLGRSVLRDASDTFGAARAAQEYGRRVLENDATPGMVLRHPGMLDEEAASRLRESWERMFSGPRNAGRVAVLEEGMTVEKVQLTAEDLQFLDTRKLQRNEIAAIFGVPPHLIGDLERATFSNIEQQSIEFVQNCIQPWCIGLEQALAMRVLSPAQRSQLEVKFNLAGIVRGDIESRYRAYMTGRQGGWLSVNDIRRLEDLNPIGTAGDVYLEPLNMQPAGTRTTDGGPQ